MSGREELTCPVCDQTFAVPEIQPAPQALGDVFGVGVASLTAMWAYQAADRVERELDRHLTKHTPQEWLPVLVRFKQERDEARRVIAVLAAEVDA